MTPSVRLLDIEGTVSPIRFVYDVLFPYARRRIPEFWPEIRDEELEALRKESAGVQDRRGAVDYLLWLMDRDRKSTPLKSIQGRIWECGYASGEIVSETFPDVLPAMQRWKAAGQRIAIFSSGSVLAQQLLFRHTNFGDLTPLIEAYFDTTIGGKKEAESYRRIAAALETAPDGIQFISDVHDELDAASGSGMQVILSLRHGNKDGPRSGRATIQSFDEIP